MHVDRQDRAGFHPPVLDQKLIEMLMACVNRPQGIQQTDGHTSHAGSSQCRLRQGVRRGRSPDCERRPIRAVASPVLVQMWQG